MSEIWDLETLVRPISEQAPAGEDIEYTLLPELDAFRVFGRPGPYEEPPDERTHERTQGPPDWVKVQNLSGEALQKSKDVRALAHLGAAVLRTSGLVAFSQTLAAAAAWLDRYWSQTYPLVEDEDVVFRRNALNYFADPNAFIDGVRRAPLVSSRQHGLITLRDVEIAAGQLQPSGDEPRPDQARIDTAFNAMPFEELQQLSAAVDSALSSLKQADTIMRDKGGTEGAPEFESLALQFGRMSKLLGTYRGARLAALSPGADVPLGDGEAAGGDGVGVPGVIRSRQDAVRSLEAVAEYFRRMEPSSPVPLFLDRAKRLVSKDFLEVLADVAPDALPQARAAGGVSSE